MLRKRTCWIIGSLVAAQVGIIVLYQGVMTGDAAPAQNAKEEPKAKKSSPPAKSAHVKHEKALPPLKEPPVLPPDVVPAKTAELGSPEPPIVSPAPTSTVKELPPPEIKPSPLADPSAPSTRVEGIATVVSNPGGIVLAGAAMPSMNPETQVVAPVGPPASSQVKPAEPTCPPPPPLTEGPGPSPVGPSVLSKDPVAPPATGSAAPPVIPVAPPKTAATMACPWTLRVSLVDGKTHLTAQSGKEVCFRVVCDQLNLQAPLGNIEAQGGVKLTSTGLEGSCNHLTICWQEDQVVMDGVAQLKCQREGQEIGLKADKLCLRLTPTKDPKAGAPKAAEDHTAAQKESPKVQGTSDCTMYMGVIR